MKTDLKSLDIIDLISERHHQLRQLIEKKWHEESDLYISNSEWYILATIFERQQTTMALIAKHIDISRQAIHKFVKRLEENGLVEINNLKYDKKKKGVQLTPFGESCYQKHLALKSSIKQQLMDQIGEEQWNLLEEILSADWGIDIDVK